jgi:hypothetical protein
MLAAVARERAGHALANPGEGYPVLEPSDRGSFTVALGPGTYSAEWFRMRGPRESPAGTSFSAPSEASGQAVLYLRKVGR